MTMEFNVCTHHLKHGRIAVVPPRRGSHSPGRLGRSCVRAASPSKCPLSFPLGVLDNGVAFCFHNRYYYIIIPMHA